MSGDKVTKSDTPLTDDAARSYTLPARYYTDAAVGEREKEAIFYRNWAFIGHQSQFAKPGDYVCDVVADQSVLVIRGKDGELRGFYNVCQHRAHLLLKQGAGNRKVITCPYHAWSYHADGRLRSARNCETLPDFDKAEFSLVAIRVETFAGFVFVNLDDDAPPLASLAPELAEDLMRYVPRLDELVVTEVSEFAGPKADWKVVVDNYLERYHCAPAHKPSADMIDMGACRVDTWRIHSRQLGPVTKPENAADDFGADDTIQNSAFWYLWPTTTINLPPGLLALTVLTFLPGETPGTTAGKAVTLRLPGDGQETGARGDHLDTMLMPEDQALCESVQRGLHSHGYHQGDYSGIGEHAVHHFHRLVKQALDEN
jgi:choline monooxygenase